MARTPMVRLARTHDFTYTQTVYVAKEENRNDSWQLLFSGHRLIKNKKGNSNSSKKSELNDFLVEQT